MQGIGERNNSAPVGMLLIQFFNLYAPAPTPYFIAAPSAHISCMHSYSNEFNMKDQVVSIRKGCLISKRSKGWERPREKNRHVICIEDPFDVDVDLGRNVDEDTVEDIRAEFRRALEILITTGDVAALIQRTCLSVCMHIETVACPRKASSLETTPRPARGLGSSQLLMFSSLFALQLGAKEITRQDRPRAAREVAKPC